MKKKRPIGVSALHRYIKGRGVRVGTGVSIYAFAVLAMAKDGLPCPDGKSDRKWVIENEEFIRAALRAAPRGTFAQTLRAETERKDRNSPRIPAIPCLDSSVDVASRGFLDTYEWRRVRMVALKKYGAVCQCCGASPKTGAVINVDHIKPRKIFPELALDVENLQVLCHECNHGKGNWDMTDWRLAEA